MLYVVYMQQKKLYILKTDQTFMYTTSLLYLSSRLNMKDIDFLNIKFEFCSWHPLLYTSVMFVDIYMLCLAFYLHLSIHSRTAVISVMQVLYSFLLNF